MTRSRKKKSPENRIFPRNISVFSVVFHSECSTIRNCVKSQPINTYEAYIRKFYVIVAAGAAWKEDGPKDCQNNPA